MIEITSINKTEALRYMGVKGQPDEKFSAMLCDCEKKLLETFVPKFTYRVFDADLSDGSVKLDGCKLSLTGKDIYNHLKDSEKAVIMAVTLSSGVDRLIRSAEISDMAQAFVLDCLASALTEQVCDLAEKEILSGFDGFFSTSRFSAGYGDMPLELQSGFIRVLDAEKKIGLCSNEASILIPRKSVTAVFGLLRSQKTYSENDKCAVCPRREICTNKGIC